jgi:hypothetical protein
MTAGIRAEAAMAAITFNATRRKASLRRQLEAVLAAFGEMLDAFVSERMRRAAAQAGPVPPRQALFSQSTNRQ